MNEFIAKVAHHFAAKAGKSDFLTSNELEKEAGKLYVSAENYCLKYPEMEETNMNNIETLKEAGKPTTPQPNCVVYGAVGARVILISV